MKKIFLLLLCFCYFLPSVDALTEVAEGSWASYNEGTLIDESLIDKSHLKSRVLLENSLHEADATEQNGRDIGFTGIGYFENGVTYYFNKYDENGNKTHDSLIVGSPDPTEPDLTLTEVTWDGDKSTWIGEGAEVWAVNYNGTGKDVLVAYAYNKLALTRATNADAELKQVEGAKIEFAYQSEGKNLYDTLIYFPEDFVYCSAIRLVDITESLKIYGGQGQDSKDGYDLDAMYGYKILYIPTQDVEYQGETAIAAGDYNLNCESSWQKVVLKVATADLKDGKTVSFDIIAGGHYKVGSGEVYLDESGEVKVRYNFNASYNLVKVNDTKVGIYKNYNNMLKKGKLLGNGQLTADEKVTLNDEFAYVRLHFDVEIPTYLIEKLEYVEEIAVSCETPKEEDKNNDCNKEENKKDECNKDQKECHKCDKKESCNKDKDNDKDDDKETCNKDKNNQKECHKCDKKESCNKDKDNDKDDDKETCNKDKNNQKESCTNKNKVSFKSCVKKVTSKLFGCFKLNSTKKCHK